MSYRHAAPHHPAPSCRAPLAVAALAIVAAMVVAITTPPAHALGGESAATAKAPAGGVPTAAATGAPGATASTAIAPGSKVTLPDVGITFTAPPLIQLSDVKDASVTWLAPEHGLDRNQPATLEFVNDARLSDCKAWQADWQQRLAAPDSPESRAGLRLTPLGRYIDERWWEIVIANRNLVVGDYSKARWEFCLSRPGGGVLLARTAGGERNVALMLSGPSAEIASALYKRPARRSAVVESVPKPPSAARLEQSCAGVDLAAATASARESTNPDDLWRTLDCGAPLEAKRAETLACRYGYWLSCGAEGETARIEGDLNSAAVLMQRACDLYPAEDVCQMAKDARKQARAAAKR